VNELTCKICRRRRPVYKRITSGELLCRHCLYSSVVKQIRKAVNYYTIVHRGERALFIARPDRPLESAFALQLLSRAVHDLDVEISVICYSSFIDCQKFTWLLEDLGIKAKVFEVWIPRDTAYTNLCFVELIKLAEAIAHYLAYKYNFNTVLTPLCRDELTLLSLLGLLKVSKSVFSESLPVKLGDGIRIARPFFYVISMDILYLTYTSHSVARYINAIQPFIPRLDNVESALARHSKDILWTSTELMYSSAKSVEMLQSYIVGSAKRCRYCLAHSDAEVCDYCSHLQNLIEETLRVLNRQH